MKFLTNLPYKGSINNFKKYHNNIKRKQKGGEIMIIIDKLVNKLKMRNSVTTNSGNVYIPDEFEVEERKKDVDANEK